MNDLNINSNDYIKYKEYYERKEKQKRKRKELYYLKKYGNLGGDKNGRFTIKPNGLKVYLN